MFRSVSLRVLFLLPYSLVAILAQSGILRADIIVANGRFDAAVSHTGDIADSGGAIPGNWLLHTSSSSPNLRLVDGTLFQSDSNTSGTGVILEQAAYQFINVGSEAGSFHLRFDYLRTKSSPSGAANGSLSVQVFGIADIGPPGWTASTAFGTSGGNHLPAPVLDGATVTSLGTFSTTSLNSAWQSDSIAFSLGATPLYDQLVVQLRSRRHLTGREVHRFDNIEISAVPEPQGHWLIGVCASMVCLGLRRRGLGENSALIRCC